MLEDNFHLAAQLLVPVLVTSESCEERELCARLIHTSGARVGGPFVICSSSGAEDTLCRQFEEARGGTLFISDIASLTAEAQMHLLILLDESLPRAGSSPGLAASEVRLIAGATDYLENERATGLVCEGLFYRLNVVHVDLSKRRTLKGTPMKTRDVMTTVVQTCFPDTDLAAVTRMMWEHDCGFIPVVDVSGAVSGVVTDRDICVATATRRLIPEHISAAQAMTTKVHVCHPGDKIGDVLATMKRFKVRRLPVIDSSGRLQGVISLNDIVIAADEKDEPPATEVVATLAAICAHRTVAGAT